MGGGGPCGKYASNANTDCASVFSTDSGPVADCLNDLAIITGQVTATAAQAEAAYLQYFNIICAGAPGPTDGGTEAAPPEAGADGPG
jgi:hypothetical protein